MTKIRIEIDVPDGCAVDVTRMEGSMDIVCPAVEPVNKINLMKNGEPKRRRVSTNGRYDDYPYFILDILVCQGGSASSEFVKRQIPNYQLLNDMDKEILGSGSCRRCDKQVHGIKCRLKQMRWITDNSIDGQRCNDEAIWTITDKGRKVLAEWAKKNPTLSKYYLDEITRI